MHLSARQRCHAPLQRARGLRFHKRLGDLAMQFPPKLAGALWLNPPVACETRQGFSQRDCWGRDNLFTLFPNPWLGEASPRVLPCPEIPRSPFPLQPTTHRSAPLGRHHPHDENRFNQKTWISTHLANGSQQLQRKSQAHATALPGSAAGTALLPWCIHPSLAQGICIAGGFTPSMQTCARKRGGDGATA